MGLGLVVLWLFGSVVRGENRTDNDLDLALVADPGSQADGDSRSSAAGLANAFLDGAAALAERAGFNLAVVTLITDDVARLSAEHDPWWLQVIRDAIPLIGERPEALVARLTCAAAFCSQSS